MGVAFFIINAIFALVLLLMVLVSTFYAIFSKNPDTRYQPMRDDRGSFIKSQSQLNTELDALGATARGDMAQTGYKSRDLDDDDSFSSHSDRGRNPQDATGIPLPPSTANSNRSPSANREPPRSPIDPSMPFLPSDGGPRHTPTYSDSSRAPYNGYNDNNSWASNGPRGAPQRLAADSRTGSFNSGRAGYRQQNNSSPWQRGAGYDH